MGAGKRGCNICPFVKAMCVLLGPHEATDSPFSARLSNASRVNKDGQGLTEGCGEEAAMGHRGGIDALVLLPHSPVNTDRLYIQSFPDFWSTRSVLSMPVGTSRCTYLFTF